MKERVENLIQTLTENGAPYQARRFLLTLLFASAMLDETKFHITDREINIISGGEFDGKTTQRGRMIARMWQAEHELKLFYGRRSPKGYYYELFY